MSIQRGVLDDESDDDILFIDSLNVISKTIIDSYEDKNAHHGNLAGSGSGDLLSKKEDVVNKQREPEHKKRSGRISGGAVNVSSSPTFVTTNITRPSRPPGSAQYTPGIRQFSAPQYEGEQIPKEAIRERVNSDRYGDHDDIVDAPSPTTTTCRSDFRRTSREGGYSRHLKSDTADKYKRYSNRECNDNRRRDSDYDDRERMIESCESRRRSPDHDRERNTEYLNDRKRDSDYDRARGAERERSHDSRRRRPDHDRERDTEYRNNRIRDSDYDDRERIIESRESRRRSPAHDRERNTEYLNNRKRDSDYDRARGAEREGSHDSRRRRSDHDREREEDKVNDKRIDTTKKDITSRSISREIEAWDIGDETNYKHLTNDEFVETFPNNETKLSESTLNTEVKEESNERKMCISSEGGKDVKTDEDLSLSPEKFSEFLFKPVNKEHGVIQCYIERRKEGFRNMFPSYTCYLKEGSQHLMTAKKRKKNRTSNYIISMDPESLRKDSNTFVGKLRSNFMGTEFVIYDNGINPKNADPDDLAINLSCARRELGIVIYASNVLGSRGPRKMKVCVPLVDDDGSVESWRSVKKKDEMLSKYKEKDFSKFQFLTNKKPKWNEQVGAYVLNFNGRVTMASVKNFQLVSPDDQETVILQFGRVGKDTFTMDLRYPLSPIQAFSICLSSFDSKLACE